MKRLLVFVFGMSLAGAQVAQAQIIDSPIGLREPIAWTSLSVGWFSQQPLRDPESNAVWDFAGAPQWRATLELPMGRGTTIGALATTARVPLIYSGGSCPIGCDADANITQYLGNLRIGGGSGFHQVIDLSAGMTVLSNFRATDGTRLGSGKSVSNFTFMIGYGFAYSISPRAQIMLLQDYGLVIQKRQPGTSSNTAQQSTLRIGVRFGLGEQRR